MPQSPTLLLAVVEVNGHGETRTPRPRSFSCLSLVRPVPRAQKTLRYLGDRVLLSP